MTATTNRVSISALFEALEALEEELQRVVGALTAQYAVHRVDRRLEGDDVADACASVARIRLYMRAAFMAVEPEMWREWALEAPDEAADAGDDLGDRLLEAVDSRLLKPAGYEWVSEGPVLSPVPHVDDDWSPDVE